MSTTGGYANKKKRYTSNIITLKPGAGKDSITIHEDLLRDHSPFFEAALDKKWKEGIERQIKLPDDSTKVVTTYVDWLYKERVQVDPVGNNQPDSVTFARLYCFGEKIQDDEFCDAVLTEMLYDIGRVNTVPGSECVSIIYHGTPEGSGMRRCLVEMYADDMDDDWDFEEGDYPLAFVFDLLREFVKCRRPRQTDNYKRRARWMKI